MIAPTEDGGFRVGWLDALPPAASEKKEEEPKPKKPATEKEKAADQKKQADEVFADAEEKAKKDKDKEAEIPPLPAEGDTDIRADGPGAQPPRERHDRSSVAQIGSRPDRQPGAVPLDVDTATLAKEQIDLNQPMNITANNLAARDALAEVLGSPGLSYRVTEEGKLYITTAARLAEDATKKGVVIEGPPIKLVMPPARKPTDPGYREITRDTLARRLAGQGLRSECVELLISQYAPVLFEPTEMIVIATSRATRSTIRSSSTSSHPPRSSSALPLWSSTAWTLAFRTEPANWSTSSAIDPPSPAKPPRPA